MSSTISQRALDAQEAARKAWKLGVSADEHYKVLNDEWETILARYPLLFAGDNIGLSAGAGWWPALEDCFADITGILNTYQGMWFNAVQIKEKFGGLRFYYDTGRTDGSQLTDELLADAREKIDIAVQVAEDKADKACEVCGQPGTRRTGGWLRTLCDTHEAMQRKD